MLASASSRKPSAATTNPDCAQVNAVIRAAIEQIKSAGAEIVEVSLPNLMDFVVETSLYITHSRHDINKFLSSRPSLPYASIDAIYRDGRYHKNLDLIDDIMTGPAQPDDDPSLLPQARRDATRFSAPSSGIMARTTG